MSTAEGKSVLTTGDVARICNVAPRTVSKWFDSGQLRGYRIPGSKDRRIPAEQLLLFMKTHGIPTDKLGLGAPRVLLVDPDRELTGIIAEALASDRRYEVLQAVAQFEAGLLVERYHPAVVVMDVSTCDIAPGEICTVIRSSERLHDVRLIATSGALTDGQGQALLQAGFSAYLRKPYDIHRLLELVQTALDAHPPSLVPALGTTYRHKPARQSS